MKNLVGTTIGQHEIQEQLGRGGMANVYKAFHPGLAVYRAIKVIRPELADSKGFQDRFQREARAVAALRHPNIVQIHDFGQVDDLFYMIMEFVEGEDLKSRMMREGTIRPFSEAVRLTEQIGDALGYAHAQGVVHRDVKPDNVLLDKDGRAILADFGIAKMIGSDDAQLTATGTGLGTPAYMAPEQAMGAADVGQAADLYALGVVLYEMLTAHLPFSADTPLAVLQRVIHDPVPPLREFTADIPDALQGVVLKAMAKEPAQRYPNAAALVEAAKQSLAGIGTGAAPAVSSMPAPPPAPANASVTEGGTVILDGEGPGRTVETRPVGEGARSVATQAGPSTSAESKKNRTPLFAALLLLGLLLLLAGAAVGGGIWWFGFRDRPADQNKVLATFSELTGSGGGFTDPGAVAASGSKADDDALMADDAQDAAAQSDPSSASSTLAVGEASKAERLSEKQGSNSGSAAPSSPERATSEPTTSSPHASQEPQRTSKQASEAGGRAASTGAWRQRRPAAQGSAPVASVPAAEQGARFLGRMRFGASAYGEVEPEQAVEYELEIKRPTTFYFDIITASRRATYTFRAPDGSEVFSEEGADVGPLTLDQKGVYTLQVETDGGIPIEFEIRFVRIGS